MTRSVMNPTLGIDFGAVIEQLRLAVFVFDGSRLLYRNPAAANLARRLRDEYQVELLVMLRDHTLRALDQPDNTSSAVTLLTAARGEPFYVHVVPIAREAGDRQVAVSVRELGIEREAFARRYRLSPREAEVAELVLRGYRNPDIAASLGVASSTVKRHLTRIFDKIGVDSRTQLIGRLA
jgi:DNA-binding CsgD family transcriptional regulator